MPVRITKGLTLDAGSATLQIAYLLENLPQDRPLHFAVELNFAGLPAGADDRYFRDLGRQPPGPARHAAGPVRRAWAWAWCDEWLGIDVGLKTSRPTHFWTFPVETVSQSEGGFELVHQSTVVQPHWFVTPDRDGRWMVSMRAGRWTPAAPKAGPKAAPAPPRSWPPSPKPAGRCNFARVVGHVFKANFLPARPGKPGRRG